MIDLLRQVALFGFIFAVYFFILRKKPYYQRKLFPPYWYRVAKAEGWKRILKVFCCSIPIIILLYFLLPMVNNFAESLVSGRPSITPGENPVAVMIGISPLLFLVVASLLPIIEEWIFRELIFSELRNKWGNIVGLLGSTFLFGFIHLTNQGAQLHAIFVPLFSGLIFGIMYLKFGLLGAYLVHGGNNFAHTVIWMLSS